MECDWGTNVSGTKAGNVRPVECDWGTNECGKCPLSGTGVACEGCRVCSPAAGGQHGGRCGWHCPTDQLPGAVCQWGQQGIGVEPFGRCTGNGPRGQFWFLLP